MATYKARGNSHNVIYPYKDETGKTKQQWETYTTELEAIQRKALIDFYQKGKKHDELLQAVIVYKRERAIERAAQQETDAATQSDPAAPIGDNTYKTYQEFIDKWLPIVARKKQFSPNTYDSYESNMKNHILPYFGSRVMSTITAEDIDNFIDHLRQKPCRTQGKSRKSQDDHATLSSPTVKKCYNQLVAGFEDARKWHYITEIPSTKAPTEKTKKRQAWGYQQVYDVLAAIEDDSLLHLAVHIAFVCSLRAGEVAGIDVKTIDLQDQSLWITQLVQRVSDKALSILPKEKIFRVFPKDIPSAKTSLILKDPKTDGSYRKQYLTKPLLAEIEKRLAQIQSDKEFFGPEYHDYGLLICHQDGSPVEPNSFSTEFKNRQRQLKLDTLIEFQGLRKSGQMHKVRLTQNNYQLVAENSGQSPEVLMKNYNEALDSEKRDLARMVEDSFYPHTQPQITAAEDETIANLLRSLQDRPEIVKQILQTLQSGADKDLPGSLISN